MGVIVSLFTGLILSPIIIRKLGPDGYAVWALSFALVDYYWFLDFGFRSATVKYVAHFNATGEPDKVAEVISTSLTYAAVISAVVLSVVAIFTKTIVKFFQVEPAYRDSFATLLVLISISWSTGVVFGLFAMSIEAVQRFDVTSRISVASTALRAVGQTLLLFFGYGLIPLALVTIAAQFLGYTLNLISFRRVFKDVHVSWRRVSWSTLRQLGGFGIHSFFISISTQIQNQSAPVLIGHFMPAAFAGYYNVPMRLVQYTVEFVGRIGIVTNSNAAELSAKGDSRALAQLAIYTNRYCLAIFMPLAILLWTHGAQFFLFWVGPKVAAYSAQVLPVLLAGYVIAVVGQFSSSMLLMGMARHQKYARGLVLETVVGLILMVIVIPRYGIVGAAWVGTTLMVADRGFYLSYLVSNVIGMRFFRYVNLIYTRPLLSAIPVLILSLIMKATWLPGASWLQLAMAGLLIASLYYPIAFFACADAEHRSIIDTAIRSRFRKLSLFGER